MKIIKIHIALIFTVFTVLLHAQSDLVFTNFSTNAKAYNPASIEDNGLINAYLGLHQQWIGWEDAPSMQWLNASTFIDKYSMGIGLNINNQKVGAELTQNIKLNYTYKLYIAGEHRLNLGLAAGIYFRKLDFSKLIFEEDEQNIPLTDERKTFADFDFGFEYSYRNWLVGISSNHITTSRKKSTLFKIPVQNHIYARYIFDAGNDIMLIPGAAYHRSGTIDLYELSADMRYQDKFSAGIMYRWSTSFVIRAGIKLNDVFELNYAYDMGAGSFRTYNSGTHEIILIGRFSRKSKSLNSPRFMD